MDELEKITIILRRGITFKLGIFFLLLFILFWFVYNGVFSKYLALIYGFVFLAIALFMLGYYFLDGYRLKKIGGQNDN
jgi:hypothetical protein